MSWSRDRSLLSIFFVNKPPVIILFGNMGDYSCSLVSFVMDFIQNCSHMSKNPSTDTEGHKCPSMAPSSFEDPLRSVESAWFEGLTE